MQPLRAHHSPVWLWRKWKDVFLETHEDHLPQKCVRTRVCVYVCVYKWHISYAASTGCVENTYIYCVWSARANRSVIWKSVAAFVYAASKRWIKKHLVRRIKTNRKINYIDLTVIFGSYIVGENVHNVRVHMAADSQQTDEKRLTEFHAQANLCFSRWLLLFWSVVMRNANIVFMSQWA